MTLPKFAIIGGPGRSGTSAVFASLLNSPNIMGIKNVEVKIFSENDGLPYLCTYLSDLFTPNNAKVFVSRLRDSLANALATQDAADKRSAIIADILCRKIDLLLSSFCVDDQPRYVKRDLCMDIIKQAMAEFYYECIKAQQALTGVNSPIFIEKTPHSLLHSPFLNHILSDPIFVHIIRDPRMTALSLYRMEWGPKTISSSIEFVKQYYYQYERIRSAGKHKIHQFRIEDLSSDEVSKQALLSVFHLSPNSISIFDDLQPTKHRAILKQADKSDCEVVFRELNAMAVSLGYV